MRTAANRGDVRVVGLRQRMETVHVRLAKFSFGAGGNAERTLLIMDVCYSSAFLGR
jgi:hypothetical protein